ncbi:DUF6443 domain-containing protein [Paraflavitalea speifideaquila]|uniref:DUF6443 domain-containing protein n=1 Tax=Paraflavitalea speifideaquila TaxID=3076558 RepID=UPI0028E40CA8|nr:DUF6443 domain-containing protein [Paraflavitalea speifideiaquila]
MTFSPFRYTILPLLLLFVTSMVYAQNPVPLPAPYNSNSNTNYIRTWVAKAPGLNQDSFATRPLRDVQQTTTYFDGLGRPLQTVIKQGSLTTGSNPIDMVSAITYDEWGREQYKYLPFAANNAGSNTSVNDGEFKLNPFQQQVQFFNTQLAGQAGEVNIGPDNLNWAYSQTNFEVSPLTAYRNPLPLAAVG